MSQHESENEGEQLWERNSVASVMSDVEVAVEVEFEDSIVRWKLRLRCRDPPGFPAMFARRVWSCKTCQDISSEFSAIPCAWL